MNWKNIFKLTKTKVISFIALTAVAQTFVIKQVMNPICTGPCGDNVHTFAWQFQIWGKGTIFFLIPTIAVILVASLLYELIKKK